METFSDIDALSPTDFEYFVRDLFAEAGWSDLEVTTVNSEFRYGDGGVDIFGRKGERRFAFEVKQRAAGTRVGVDALNQLQTGAELAKVKNRVLVTNRHFTSEAKTRALRLGIDLVDRDELKTMWEGRGVDLGKRIKPRKYQKEVVDTLLAQFAKGNSRFLIEMATGLGKTITAALVVRELERAAITAKGRPRVLFLAHQIELLEQAAKSFRNILRVGDYSYSACFDGALPEPTDLVFATFDTMLSHIADLAPHAFDIVIVDEAHHVAAKTYATVVRHFSPKAVIGLTATPYRTDAQDIFQFFGGDEGHIGKYDLSWALKNRHLAFPSYKVFLDDLTPDALQQLAQGFGLSDIDKRLFLRRRDEEIVRIIEDALAENKIASPRVIVFCRSIAHLRNLIQSFSPGSAVLIHSRMTDAERRNNIEAFREGRFTYALVCDLFNEGIDIPEANALVFLRYTGSRTIWLQQLGRGLRKVANKDVVHVLDFVGSLQRLKEIDGFRASVEAAPLELTTDNGGQEGPHYDSSIEVKYSVNAAQVLALVERLEMRLTTRSDALEALRSWKDGTERPDLPEAFFDEVQSVSPDQVRTLFASWKGFLAAAFGSEIDTTAIRARALAYAVDHVEQSNGVTPSLTAVSLATAYRHMPTATESELRDIFGSEQTFARLVGGRAPQESPEEVHGAEEGPPRDLLDACVDSVFNVADIANFPAEVQAALLAYQPSRFWWVREVAAERKRRQQSEAP